MNKFEIITLKKPKIKDFAKARNDLLKKSKSEWVFFLDSDEKATSELLREITTMINKVRNLDGYYIKRKIIFCGQKVGEDNVLRLGKRNAGKWERSVHETWNIKTRFGTLQNYIIHNTADNLHDYIRKVNYYSDLHARENIKEGKKSSLCKIIFYPAAKFVSTLVKSKSIVFSIMQSLHSFLSWSKQWLLENT